MNELIKIDGVLAMDSREIARLLGARHADVIESISTQLPKVGYTAVPYTYTNEQNGQRYQYYCLPYRETMILVSGYSVELRAKIIDRWMELETANAPKVPKTYAEALQLAADQAKALEIAAPKVESFEALQRSDQTMSITAAAKHFGLHPKTQVFPYLRDMRYLTERDLPTQAAIDAGYLALRETECGDGEFRPQAVVLACQLETWRTRVIPQIKAWEIRP
jgi:phage antirepressor YoqD-like protein